MGPVILTTLITGAIICSPLLARVAYLVYHIVDEAKKKNAKMRLVKKARRYEKDKEYQKEVDRERAVLLAINRSNNIIFTNDNGSRSVNIDVNTITDFDITKEVVLRGKLHFRLPNTKVVTQPIFLFQPRCVTNDGKKVGPILTKKGRLHDKKPYLVKLPDTGEIVRSYVPKREVVSGINFDFVEGSVNFQDENLKRFLYIELETDENGHYIPVDFNDQKQLVGFKKYLQFFSSQTKAIDYFMRIYETAIHSSKVLEVKEAIAYRATASPKQVLKEEPTGLQAEDPYAFYDRYNYNREAWMGAPGTEYDRNEDIVGHAMGIPPGPPPGGMGHGGPRR